jgi:hypothetical protein
MTPSVPRARCRGAREAAGVLRVRRRGVLRVRHREVLLREALPPEALPREALLPEALRWAVPRLVALGASRRREQAVRCRLAARRPLVPPARAATPLAAARRAALQATLRRLRMEHPTRDVPVARQANVLARSVGVYSCSEWPRSCEVAGFVSVGTLEQTDAGARASPAEKRAADERLLD